VAMSKLASILKNSPGLASKVIRQNASEALQSHYQGQLNAEAVMSVYTQTLLPTKNNHQMAYVAKAVSTALDSANNGDMTRCLDLLYLLLAAVEQSAWDGGSWHSAWPLLHLEEPHWAHLQPPRHDGTRPFNRLVPIEWVGASMSYQADVIKIQEMQKQLAKGRSKGKGKKPDDKKDG
jgi:hypothetical protein